METDWNTLWRSRVEASVQAMGGNDCARSFDQEASARNYWKMVRDAREFVDGIVEQLPVERGGRVLDIGAGPGTLTLPLAARAAHVTAVEPSGAMARVLNENIRDTGLDNIFCIPKKWEAVDPDTDLDGPYDLVVASFSLGMPDIRPAIEKMIQACSGHVALFWFTGPSSWDDDYRFIFNTFFNREFPEMPKGDILFNLLFQMGIHPNVSVFPGRMDHHYPNLDLLVSDVRQKMPGITNQQETVLRDYFQKVVEERENSIVLPYTWESMKLWWEVS